MSGDYNPKCCDSSLNVEFTQNQKMKEDRDKLKEKIKSTYTKMKLRAPL
jgi:hypothetical protein